ncbi:hypothetical protein BLOT_006524, partial [Blomia tropicalis]
FSLICLAIIGITHAAPYSSNGGSSYSNYGQSSMGSYGGSSGYGDGGSSGKSAYGGQQDQYSQPQVIEVSPEQLPVQVHFRTASSRVNVQQSHNQQNMAPQVEHASFQDEPHRVVHEIVKPVIQEVREIIQPYRRVTQEVRPVIEEVHTVVHKSEGRGRGGNGAGLGGGSGAGAGGQLQKGYGQQYKSKA